MKTCYPTTRTAAAQQGYSLVELLVAISLGSVVLASLGGVLLVSEMKVSAKIQRNLDAKDAANRAIDLMRREANSSLFLTNSLSRNESSSDCLRTSPVVYYQTNGSKICYKTVPPNWDKLPSAYQNVYQGPCLLVREGPPYKPDGEIDDLSGSIVRQVVLDGVAKTKSANCTSRSNQGLIVAVGKSNAPDQKATIKISLDQNNLDYKFSVQRPSNPAYDGNSLYTSEGGCTIKSNKISGCGTSADAVVSHLPENYSSVKGCDDADFDICGNPLKETVFYFVKPFSQYVLSDVPGSSSPCTYAKCYVQKINGTFSVRLSNVDHLVFPDKEIRPSS
jgi:prepilin-type N-terminal cleavage/methylation domain-containing protein